MAKLRNRHKHKGFRFSVILIATENGTILILPTKVEGICYESVDRVLEMVLRSGETKKNGRTACRIG